MHCRILRYRGVDTEMGAREERERERKTSPKFLTFAQRIVIFCRPLKIIIRKSNKLFANK